MGFLNNPTWYNLMTLCIPCRVSGERELFPFIVCTQELLSVRLLDSGTDELQLRLAYSMAIIRFLCLKLFLLLIFNIIQCQTQNSSLYNYIGQDYFLMAMNGMYLGR